MTTTAKRPSSTTVLLVCGLVAALMVGVDIRKSTITGAKIKNSSLTGADVKKGSLTGSDLKDGSLTGVELALGSVTSDRLAPDAKPMVAVVGANGILVRGEPGVESVRLGEGTYEVRFPVTVSSCDYSATIGQTQAINPVLGMIAVAPRHQEPESLFVATTNASGDYQNRGFFLFVYC